MDTAETISGLKKEVSRLKKQLRERDKEIRNLKKIISKQAAIILKFEDRFADLERRLKQNSTNSSKPPSTDGLKKPAPKSLRTKSEKKAGGQKGHEGKTRRQVKTTQKTVTHVVEVCPCCATDLSHVEVCQTSIRQVIDIKEPETHVTDHVGEVKQCPKCRKQVSAIFPEDVKSPVQFGGNVRAAASYWMNYQLIPVGRTAQLFRDFFGIDISPATLQSFDRVLYSRLAPWEEATRSALNSAKVKHSDESGLRVLKSLLWLHVLSTPSLTLYRVSEARGEMPEGLSGVLVHDHWKSYYTIEGILNALCNSHHLRELASLIEHEQEDWAEKMSNFLKAACHEKNSKTYEELQNITPDLERQYDALVKLGLEFHEALEIADPLPQKSRGTKKRRRGHNLLIRFRDFKEDVLRFLHDPDVPFTNNLSEQDIRMIKLKLKISGCFRTLLGAAYFARIRSYVSTMRKQGLHILTALKQAHKLPIPAAM